jgi:hypothetical protein
MQYTSNKFLPTLIAFALFFVIAFLYFSPVLEKKEMVQSDLVQVLGYLQESFEYGEKDGEPILWSNSSFSGMPVWRGYQTNVFSYIHKALTFLLPVPVLMTFLCFAGFYILQLAFRINPWIAIAGSFAYTFASFTFISIDAGHINKVYDMAFIAPVLAGIVFLYQKDYLKGALIVIIASGMLIFYEHIQIIYYTTLLLLCFVVSKFIEAIQQKEYKSFIIASLISLGCGLVAIVPSYSKLSVLADMAPHTTRGGSELSEKSDKSGLDKDYAFAWSYGKFETLTLLIPNLYGGSSHENIGIKSESYQTLIKAGVPRNQAKDYVSNLPTYWGDQPFTSGPVYVGAIVCFLFILGTFLIKGQTKVWLVSITVLSILLSWGKNFEWFSDLFFNYFPLYNKFRSVTMILALCQVSMALLAFITLNEIFRKKIPTNELLKKSGFALAITGGVSLLVLLFGSSFLSFSSENDSRIPDWLLTSLQDDRISMLKKDALRSLVFVLLIFGAIYLYLKEKLNQITFSLIVVVIVVFDMFPVDKRYLNNDDFHNKEKYLKQVFAPNKIDKEILKDKATNYKVLNLTVNPFTDAKTSYLHKSVGGYSAIKLSRYQDLIEHHIGRNNQEVWSMLNTKYIIYKDQKTEEPMLMKNPDALGNAWFVDSVTFVNGAREEIDALTNFGPASNAIVDLRFEDYLLENKLNKNPEDEIALTSYHPNKLTYTSKSANGNLAVFSEIYYNPGWQAYINDKPVEHIRVNYVLRALYIPAGIHKIEFKFEPPVYKTGEKISMIGSILCILTIAGLGCIIFIHRRKEKKSNTDVNKT